MGTTLYFLCAVFLLSLIGKGYCLCTLASIKISQTSTGQVVQNKPQWKVTITNDCNCTQSDLILDCNGFNTVENVDSSIIVEAGGHCLVNNGNPVTLLTPVDFTYAWDTSFPFRPMSSLITCS